MRLISALAAGAALAASEDAGRLRPDAGTVAPSTADAGTPLADAGASLEGRRDVERLSAEVQLLREQNRRQAGELAELKAQLEQVRAELSQAREARLQADQAREQAALEVREQEREREVRRLAAQDISAGLLGLDARLATGDTDVMATLVAAERTAGPRTRVSLAAARAALANGDVAAARRHILQAASDAEHQR
jgi:predicted RNase H-like nuclease (RuvC/YqgF family)